MTHWFKEQYFCMKNLFSCLEAEVIKEIINYYFNRLMNWIKNIHGFNFHPSTQTQDFISNSHCKAVHIQQVVAVTSLSC